MVCRQPSPSQSFSIIFPVLKSFQAKIFEFCRGGSYAYNEQGPCLKSGSDSTYVFDNHNQEGQLDCQGLLGVERASDEVGADVRAHNFEDRRRNIRVGDALNVAITDVLIPNLEGLRSKREKWVSDKGNLVGEHPAVARAHFSGLVKQ